VLSADVWVAAHHVGFTIDGARFGLLPLGLLVVPFLLLRLSGAWAARILKVGTLPDAALLVITTSVVYGLLGALVAAFAGRDDAYASPFESLLGCTVVALVSTAWTVVRTSGLGPDVADLLPAWVRSIGIPALAGLLTVVAGSALIVAVLLVLRFREAESVTSAIGGGVVGGLALTLVGLLYLPNLVVWAAAFCIGPGFAVGAGTSVTLAGVSSGPLPAFPLLAVIPSTGVPSPIAWLCLLVPVAGGIVAARATARMRPGLDPESTALWAGVAGVVAGLGLGVLAWLAGGPLGDERLSVVGPSAWQVGMLAALEIGMVAAVAGWLTGWRASSRNAVGVRRS
jgi:hypothetical protein